MKGGNSLCDKDKFPNLSDKSVLDKYVVSTVFNLFTTMSLKTFSVSWKHPLSHFQNPVLNPENSTQFFENYIEKILANNKFKCGTHYFMNFKTKNYI